MSRATRTALQLNSARLAVEAGLNAVTNQADGAMGVEPVEPEHAADSSEAVA